MAALWICRSGLPCPGGGALRFIPVPCRPPSMSPARPRVTGILLVLASAVLFSTKSIFIKLAYQEPVTPIALLTLRMAFAMPFFLVMVAMAEHRAPLPAVTTRSLPARA